MTMADSFTSLSGKYALLTYLPASLVNTHCTATIHSVLGSCAVQANTWFGTCSAPDCLATHTQ